MQQPASAHERRSMTASPLDRHRHSGSQRGTDLARSVRRLHAYLRANFPCRFASPSPTTQAPTTRGDRLRTRARTRRRTRRLPDAKGRGRALHAVWSASDADVLCYMDVDLSTDLAALLPLVAPLLSGHSDVAIGTRLVALGPCRARPEARAHFSLLQRACCGRRSRPGSPMRNADSRRCEPTVRANCCRWCRTTAGSSTPNCSCWPSARACGSTRCRSTGSTTRIRASTSSRPRSPICAASRGWAATCARGRIALCDAHRREASPLGKRATMVAQLFASAVSGIASTVGVRRALPVVRAPPCRRRWANALALLINSDRQHRSQPLLHLRCARPHRRGCNINCKVSRSSASASR